jgi:hypothetical protein
MIGPVRIIAGPVQISDCLLTVADIFEPKVDAGFPSRCLKQRGVVRIIIYVQYCGSG